MCAEHVTRPPRATAPVWELTMSRRMLNRDPACGPPAVRYQSSCLGFPFGGRGGGGGGGGGGALTVNAAALVVVPPGLVTEIGPLVAPLGTVVVICVSPETLNVAAVPLKLTLVAPVKPVPVMVTAVPASPDVGEKLVIVGGAVPVRVNDQVSL